MTPTVHLLGTGAAVSDPHRTTTMMAFTDGTSTLLVDCGGDAIQRMLQSGINLDTLDALILTHEHPDHVGGFALLMERLWLMGRRTPLPIYGPEASLDQARRCFSAYDTSRWEGLPERLWYPVPLEEQTPVLQTPTWDVIAAPGDHGVPVIGIRVMHRPTGQNVTYSCDTRPSDAITRLAQGTDFLIHEATGAGPGHASIEEAAEVARKADAARLVLVHLPAGLKDTDLTAGRKIFPNMTLGEELGVYPF